MMRALKAAACLLLGVSTGALAALPDYRIVEVYPSFDPNVANAVSNTGIVVGCHGQLSLGFTAFMWQDGKVTELFPGCATAVNDNGVIGGFDEANNAVIYDHGTLTRLGVPGEVRGINNAGWAVVGWGSDQNNSIPFSPRAWLYHDGQLSDLPDGCNIRINNLNQILCDGGIRQPDGSMTTMPGASYPSGFDYPTLPFPRGLTDQTQVVGQGRGLLYYADGATTKVPNTPSDAAPIDLNSWPLLVGDEEGFYGFIANPQGETKFLSEMSGVKGFSWNKLSPRKINESGWIAGYASHGPTSGSQTAFVMIPIATPEPRTPGAPIAGLPVLKRPRADFNADARNDLVWRANSGEYGAWLMDGNRVQAAGFIAAPANATLRFRADFDGDGRGDLVFQDASGAWWITLMNGMSASSRKILDGGSGWEIVGVGDFNGARHASLLWYHPTQGFGVWIMNGTVATIVSPIAYPNHAWPAAIGDFNGDGHDDIAWIGDDGHIEIWAMYTNSATPLGTIREAGTGFVPAFVDNFNGDGHDDIVWKHPDGRYSLWLMNGATMVNSTAILGAGSGWHVIGTPDFDGNGTADLLFRADDGSVGGWLMSGTTQTSYALFLSGGSGWDVVADSEVSGDFKADLLWRYRDGSYGLWLMNGLTPTSTQVMLQGGTGWELVP